MYRRALKPFIVVFLLLSTFLFLSGPYSTRATPAYQEVQSSLFLPLVLKRFPTMSVFGAEMIQIDSAGGLDRLASTGADWVRRNAVLWSDVEPTQGTRNWSAPSIVSLDQELINAANQAITPILIVRSTPTWAQVPTGSSCGPVAQTAFGPFANFMQDLVARYSAAPYNVKYWEIWNEPDADQSLPGDNPYGCWGDRNDSYYGGRDYGKMLQLVYPQIKSADPQAQVLVGGLLLNCQPNGGCVHAQESDVIAKFLQGILVGGGGPYFDGVSFHAYDVYWYQVGQYGVTRWNSAWNTTGPTVIAKSNFVKSVLTSYGVPSKFLMNTETGLLCLPPNNNPDYCNNNADFETTKAYYVAQVYPAAIAQGLKANIWFSMYGWQNSGLLDSNGNPLPAYTAFLFASQELKGTRFSRDLSYTGVKGYELDREDIKIWVLWSLDGSSHTIALPGVPSGEYHVDGTPISPNASLTVTLEPVYLEWNH